MTPETAANLQRDTKAGPAKAPNVPGDLASAVTNGPWVAGDALDSAFATSDYRGRAFLDVKNAVLVLMVVGGNP